MGLGKFIAIDQSSTGGGFGRPALVVRALGALSLVACALASLALAGCGANRRSFFGGDVQLLVAVAEHANGDTPVKVDLLVLYDLKVLESAAAMTAAEWFAGREQFGRDHPEGYQAWSWEWVPGQEVPPSELSFGLGARAGLVFADYATPGAHRVRFDPHTNVRLLLQEHGFTAEVVP